MLKLAVYFKKGLQYLKYTYYQILQNIYENNCNTIFKQTSK